MPMQSEQDAQYLALVRPPSERAWGWSAFLYHRPPGQREVELIGFSSHAHIERLLKALSENAGKGGLSVHVTEGLPGGTLARNPMHIVSKLDWERAKF